MAIKKKTANWDAETKEEKKVRTIDEILKPYKEYERKSVSGKFDGIKVSRIGQLFDLINQAGADKKELCSTIDKAVGKMKKESEALKKKWEKAMSFTDGDD